MSDRDTISCKDVERLCRDPVKLALTVHQSLTLAVLKSSTGTTSSTSIRSRRLVSFEAQHQLKARGRASLKGMECRDPVKLAT